MRVAVAGSSTIACLIAQAVKSNTSHSSLILADQNLEFLQSTGLNIYVVDYSDRASVRYALTGVHVVIVVSPGIHERVLLQEALNCRVRRFVPAHFAAQPVACHPLCPLDQHRAEMRRMLAEHRAELQSCLIVCGILYENFQPGGLSSANGERNSIAFEDFPIDVDNMTALMPTNLDPTLPISPICLTSAQDLTRCITTLLDMASWPVEIRIHSERMSVERLLTTIEGTRGEPFARTEHDEVVMSSALRVAVERGDIRTQSKIHHALSISQGLADYEENRLQDLFPTTPPMRFREWLSTVWEP